MGSTKWMIRENPAKGRWLVVRCSTGVGGGRAFPHLEFRIKGGAACKNNTCTSPSVWQETRGSMGEETVRRPTCSSPARGAVVQKSDSKKTETRGFLPQCREMHITNLALQSARAEQQPGHEGTYSHSRSASKGAFERLRSATVAVA